jgi:putative transposase
MITAATYLKTPFFASRERLDLLQGWIFDLSLRYGAALQAWAIFPNHYHFIAALKEPTSLSRFIGHIHTKTAMDVNRLDGIMGRRVWFQFWDSHLTHRGSYFARLRYVHENAVRHGVVHLASNYPWCSAGWLERKATTAFRKTILKCRCESVSVRDNFEVKMDFLDGA